MDSFKIVFMKDTFERENRLSERQFLTKFWSDVVFRKDNFEKYKHFGQKMSFKERRFSHLKVSFIKTILNESIFQINITRVMFGLKT
jgi:hypothetical protein